MSTNGDVRALYAQLRKQGWRVEMGGKHLRLYAPGATELTVTCPASPGNPNAHYHDILNLVQTGVPDKASTFAKREVNGKDAFTCSHCRTTSHNPNDIANHYCAKCSHYCDDVDLLRSVGL